MKPPPLLSQIKTKQTLDSKHNSTHILLYLWQLFLILYLTNNSYTLS